MAVSFALRASSSIPLTTIPKIFPRLCPRPILSPLTTPNLKTLTLTLNCSSSSSPPLPHTEEVKTTTINATEASVDEKDLVKAAAEALDIRVGRILKAWRHPDADSLYVEEVDVGEPEPRTICSGLVNYIPQDHLQDRNVVVLANLKPRNMRGIKSNGMLMAASDAAHENVELLMPPEGSAAGERIWFGSSEDSNSQPDAASPNQVQKKKIWETVQPHLKTTDNCIVVLEDRPMRTSAGFEIYRLPIKIHFLEGWEEVLKFFLMSWSQT